MEFKNIDCALIKDASNLFYYTRYSNSDALLILTENKKYYLTDARYIQEAHENLFGFEIIDINRDLFGALKAILSEGKYRRIGYEGNCPLNFYSELTQNIKGVEFVEIGKEIAFERSIKTEEEIQLIKKAQAITDKTFEDILSLIKEGMTEIELGRILNDLLYQNGADQAAFESIVAFGPNSAKPHALKTKTKLKNNSVIKVDFGAKYKGYCSDMTRTVFFGGASQKQKEIYQHVLNAQNAALENVYTGIGCPSAYALANDYFVKENLDKYFLHSLGHGIGVDVHERPALSPKSNEILQENMVVSIEPGLYYINEFGIRIEDIILFKKTTVENLTKSVKQMIIL